ncbi:MAG: M3 family metallopeptidase [Bacteroidales bacterium]|jgi:peptidyl-dipeptidase Dcp|nr:M3 family metallopeptidase [Bacteroidales bacterium]
MKKTLFTMLSVITLLSGCTKGDLKDNPLVKEWDTPFGTPPFELIESKHYLPAFEEGIKQHSKEIEDIINNKEEANFENTIAAFDFSGQLLAKVSGVFFNMTAAKTDADIQAIEEKVGPMMSSHNDEVLMNNKLFERVKKVYDNKDKENLNQEQKALLEKTYKKFVRSGALLDNEKQSKLKEVNKEITALESKFVSNLLKETKSYELVVDKEEDLKGLPEWLIASAKETAKNNKKDGKWVFTLDNPSVFPFITYAENRDLRKEIFNARINRGNNGNENDNKEIITKIVNLRATKAELLGYKTFADYVLEERMNKTPGEVYKLLEGLLAYSIPAAQKDAKELQALLEKDHKGETLEAWDWFYYSEKLKQKKFNFNEEETRPYFEINNVRQGCFDVLTKLFGVTFTQRDDIAVYEKDVTVFECKNEKGEHLGIMYWDPFTRASKVGGAWCNSYREQYVYNDKKVTPIITVCFNYAKSPSGRTTLTAEEASTVFHEMGHAIHCLLSDCQYVSTSGTSVPRDFVELPSQILEHWCSKPEVLKMYAKNEKGEVIPEALIKKIESVGAFNAGFSMSERFAAAYLDMEYHVIGSKDEIKDVLAFEKKAMDKIGLISQIPPRYRSTYFSHVFGGGYAVGYYSYVWSEVLDADAFQAFEETGNIFDKATADRFKNEILSKGSTRDAMDMYKSFRGKAPSIDAVLKNNGMKN